MTRFLHFLGFIWALAVTALGALFCLIMWSAQQMDRPTMDRDFDTWWPVRPGSWFDRKLGDVAAFCFGLIVLYRVPDRLLVGLGHGYMTIQGAIGALPADMAGQGTQAIKIVGDNKQLKRHEKNHTFWIKVLGIVFYLWYFGEYAIRYVFKWGDPYWDLTLEKWARAAEKG